MRANPILVRELRERWRTSRARLLFVLFLVVVSGVALASSGWTWAMIDGDRHQAPTAAVAAFRNTMVVLMAFVCVVAPGVAAASISSERERQTLRLVHVTLLRPREILLGKVAASLAFLGVLVVCTLPVAAVTLATGGVAVAEAARGYLMVAVVGIFLAFAGGALSAWTKRSLTSVGAAYLVLALLLGGTAVAFIQVRDARFGAWQARLDEIGHEEKRKAERERFEDLKPRRPTWTVVLNPMVALASAIEGDVPASEQYRYEVQGERAWASTPRRGPTDGLFALVTNEATRAHRHASFVAMGRPSVDAVRQVFPQGDVTVGPYSVVVRRHTPVWWFSAAWYLALSALAAGLGTLGLRRAR